MSNGLYVEQLHTFNEFIKTKYYDHKKASGLHLVITTYLIDNNNFFTNILPFVILLDKKVQRNKHSQNTPYTYLNDEMNKTTLDL